ncbi:MAG: ABC transporter ATP-binding protein [Rhodospirillaceae bacterium]|nr:ABC transporter ATP-binding protein [Rhodospirillaceae bacterium]
MARRPANGQAPAQFALDVRGLTTSFYVGGKWFPAVRDVSFALKRHETLALVGESGCGKSMTAMSIMGLVPKDAGRVKAEAILFEGQDLARASEAKMREVRGDGISMVFQEPMTSLNPVLTIGFQVSEALRHHRGLSRRDAAARALHILDQVKIPSAKSRFNDYPHQFSGGMRQRVMIAMALACQPKILLADEPTTALDVTIQAQILELLRELKRETGMAMIFITHNLGVVAELADRVAVMYAGQIVEIAEVAELFARPTHPYTEALLRSIPRSDRDTAELYTIPGQVPPITRMPPGCKFADRCAYRLDRCQAEEQQLAPLAKAPAHAVRCWRRTEETQPEMVVVDA